MRKFINCLFLFLLINSGLSAQVNRQLKKIDQQLANFEIAESKKNLNLLAKKITKRHKKYGQFLFQQAKLYELEGAYEKALKTVTKASKYATKKDQAAYYVFQGELAFDLERFNLADSLLNTALNLLKSNRNNHFLLKTKIETYLGGLYIEKEQYAKADAIYTKVKNELETKKATQNEIYVEVLYRIAESKLEQEKFELADSFLVAATLFLTQLTESHPEVKANILVQNGRLFIKTGKQKEAEKAFIDASNIILASYGKNNFLYIKILRNLALSYSQQGKYAKAEEKLLEVKNSPLLSNRHSPTFAFTMNSFGKLYDNTGKYEKAIAAYSSAKDILKALGRTSDYGICLNNLAEIYSTVNQPQKSTALFEEGKAFLEEKNKTNSQIYAAILINLGLNYVDENQAEKAKATLEKAKALVLKIFGQEHPYYASVIINLAHLYEKTNQLEKARDFYLETERLDKLILGEKHPYFMSTLSNTANIYALLEQPDTALTYYQRLIEGQTNLIYNYYSTFEEATRLSYLKESMDYFEEFYSFVARQDTIDAKAYIEMQNSSLATKSLALDFSVDNKIQIDSLQNPEGAVLLKKWTDLRQQLSQAYTLSEKEKAQANFNLVEMEEAAILLEKQLVRGNEAMSKQLHRQQLVIFEDMQAVLKPSEVALDFIKFSFYQPERKTDSVFYGVLLTSKNTETPRFIYLAEEKQLQKILRAKIRSNGSNYVANPKIGSDLYQLLWQPLVPYLEGVKTVKISPTGLLHKVSFAALPTTISGSATLMHQYRFDYYGNMRDLVKQATTTTVSNNSIALVGGANFDLDSLALQQLATTSTPALKATNDANLSVDLAKTGTRSVAVDSTRSAVRFNYLPGTAKEVSNIEQQFQQANWQVQTFVKNQALEDNIKLLSGPQAPSILHLATHGYFFAPLKKQQKKTLTLKDRIRTSSNPLIRSGLVFTGVNHTWKGGGRIPNLDDGVLTAYEISNLDLFTTNLVILSACETGLGDIYDTEGVFGLQRAFKMAGVQQLITSLWKIPDQQTQELMTTFYQFYLQSNDAANALYQAQLAMSEKYRPFYWAGFILAK